ncbi:MAG: FtsH protease activity modulator HflK [Rehaibacterium terrae]|uniref:FtsH protease activity modulator HflK n=1 Tax=Rehaibacterium terrae TaxID=1341696 RepID=UPI0039189B66
MAWNEPGKGGGKEPWKGRDPGDDVEAFLNRLKANLGRVFGGGSPPRNGKGGAPGAGGLLGWAVLLLAIWIVFDSWQMIDERQRGVVLRFGKFDRLMSPGPNFKWPRPIETVEKVDVTQVRSLSDQVRLLTRDENIVQIEFNVQYLVSDPRGYLFGTREPDDTLRQAAESAVRDVIGSNEMDTILTGERAALAAEARTRLQATLDSYGTGLQVSVLNLQNARPPAEVREAFDDAISAREDRERIESEAQAYASKVVPEARGTAARIRTEAEGYKQAMIARAEGDAERFRLLVDEYRKAPEVTRRRLYLETMQEVLANNRKVYSGDSGNVLYLPLGGQSAGDAPMSRLPAAGAALPALAPSTDTSPRTSRTGRTGREESRR